jgi:hypothetical protein
VRAWTLAALMAAGAMSSLVAPASAQQPRPVRAAGAARVPAASTVSASHALRTHFGVDAAIRLMRSMDSGERLRGIERAAAIHSPEALELLERAVGPSSSNVDRWASTEGVARQDPRALLVAVRALAAWTDSKSARDALAGSILDAKTSSLMLQVPAGLDPATQEAVSASRVELAREQAAIALAQSGHPDALDDLLSEARSGGAGQESALEALSVFPPAAGLFGGVALATPETIALAAGTGDLRVLDSVEGVLAASDPAVRAAALAALGLAGDARVQTAALQALQDRNPRVRVAAAEALARLGVPAANQAVENLIADDTTARDGLRLAQMVQGAGVARAAATRAAASADEATRSAALVALGRQVDPLAVEALVSMTGEPLLAGDAADALARSPSAAAMPALEKLAAAAGARRLALRAYFVRRWVRGERSAQLDALPGMLATSPDPVDRGVATQVQVALGERSLASALGDADPPVQRAAAMGALALSPSQRGLAVAAGLPVVRDEAAREVLAFVTDDADGAGVPTLALLEHARGGGADAPLAAMALARRSGDELEPQVDALLASSDPALRAQAATGLGASHARDATGRLARAYEFEADVEVRRALVRALAARLDDAAAPARRDALSLAARLDPDRVTRTLAARAEAGEPLPSPPAAREVAWVRLLAAPGATIPSATCGTLTGADGVARPVVFDDDGYALVPGLPAGDARLRLASRVGAYESP